VFEVIEAPTMVAAGTAADVRVRFTPGSAEVFAEVLFIRLPGDPPTRYSITRGADLARITALVVSANCSRQGIGRQLLREAEAIARRAQAPRIEVTSNPRREIAHAFYLGCGYKESSKHFIKLLGD
jgi:GNAT superfamily N-acetyltransferase